VTGSVPPVVADLLAPHCGCQDCESAVSPGAYLATLLDYAVKHVRNGSEPLTTAYFAERFHQPIGDLPLDCSAAETSVTQVRIAVEVLRAYLGARPLLGAGRETGLAAGEAAYLLAAYTALLASAGTTYEEIRRARSASPEFRTALAERLGVSLTPPPAAAPREDELDRLFRDPEAPPGDPLALTGESLERIFGLAATTGDPLSDGLKSGDVSGQFARWTFDGADPGRNADAEGTIYLSVAQDGAAYVVSACADAARTLLVAAGARSTPGGPVRLTSRDGSGLSGVVELAYTADAADASVAVAPLLLCWRLSRLRAGWFAEDWPDNPPPAAGSGGEPPAPLVDPQTIGLADLRSTRPGAPAYDLWLVRVKELADRRAALIAARDAAGGPAAQLDAVIALALSLPDDAVTTARLTDLDTAERKGERIESRLGALGLTPAAFRFLMPIIALASAGQSIIAPEWDIVFDTLIVARKRRDFPAWRAAEKAAGVTLSPDHFRVAADDSAPEPARRVDIAMWLSTREGRRVWGGVLQARVDQEANVGAGVSSARNATEETALPLLRDALIQASDAEGADLPSRAEWLTRRLLVDMRMSGAQRTTRVAQAIETLQELMFRLRTGQLAIDNPDPRAVLSSVRAAATPDGRTHLLARDQDGALWHRVWDGRWRSWRPRGPSPGAGAPLPPSDLAVTARGDGLDVAVVSGDRAVWVRHFETVWADWEKVPGGPELTGSLALASGGPDVLDAYVLRIGDLEVLRRRWDGAAWAAAEDIGASSHREPAAVAWTPDTVDLVLARPAPDLFAPLHRSWDGVAWQDENLDGTLGSDPALIAPAAGRLELFQNLSGRLYRKVFDGGWQPWENVDAALTASDPKIQGAPAACAPAPGIVDVYAVRHEAGVWFRRFAADVWSAWEAVPSENLELDAPQFDAEWEWVGSHPTFRSATFVRLYPDNLLLPSLAPRQTPAFSKLLAQTRPTQRITRETACQRASEYAAYLQDVSGLRVQASCHVVAAVASSDVCKAAAPAQQALTLMFARAPSGRVYWSSFDPAAVDTGYPQSFWKEIPLGGSDGTAPGVKVRRIVAALPWISEAAGQHHVYLFLETDEPAGYALKRTRMDLERYDGDDAWPGGTEEVDLPPNATINFDAPTVVPVQSDNYAEAPRLAFHVSWGLGTYIRELDSTDGGFAPGEWAAFEILPRYRDPSALVAGGEAARTGIEERAKVLLAALHTGGQTWIVYQSSRAGQLQVYARNAKWGETIDDGTSKFCGALPHGPSTIFVFSKRDGQNVYQSVTYSSSGPFTLGALTLGTFFAVPEVGQVVAHSGPSASFFVTPGAVLTPGALGHTYARLCRVEGDKLVSAAKFDVVPVLGFWPSVPTGQTVLELQVRRLEVRGVYQDNAAASESILTYLREQFRLVPQQLGLTLQASGEYVAALDWFATVYDYRAPLADRYIDYGLALDAALPATSVLRFPEGWLLDPLNPHAIARTRRGATARFAIANIMRCLNDFADAQFTIDTSESLPIARLLYDTALGLAEVPEFKQALPDCGELIGALEIEPGASVPPEVAAALGAIAEDLTQGAAFPAPGAGVMAVKLVNAVTRAKSGLIGWDTVLPQLLEFKDTSQAAAQPPATAYTTLAGSAVTRAAVHAALLADPGVEQVVRLAGSLGAGVALPVTLAPRGSQ